MKYFLNLLLLDAHSRSPHGERGLKFRRIKHFIPGNSSLPPRGAWIEILASPLGCRFCLVAPPTGSVD